MRRIAACLLAAAAFAGCAAPASPPTRVADRAPRFNDDGTVCRDPSTGTPVFDR